MIMQGNTPRSLTWPGCLAVVALGLTILPMLPSLHGQAPREENKARDQLEEAEKALEKAKAALELQKAELDRKMKELKATQARARVVESVRSEALLQLDGWQTRTQPGTAVKKATFRIEITVPANENVKDVLAKIRKALPEKLHGNIALRPVTVIHHAQIGGEPPAARPAPPRIEFTAPITPQPATASVDRAGVHGHGSSSEKRINELEKKLEKVLRELHELRKQIGNTPPPTGYSAPTATSPATGYAPPGYSAPTATSPATGYAPPAVPLPYPANPPPATDTQGPFKLLKPQPGRKQPSSTPKDNDSLDNPYYAPTVPLKPEPVDDSSVQPPRPYRR